MTGQSNPTSDHQSWSSGYGPESTRPNEQATLFPVRVRRSNGDIDDGWLPRTPVLRNGVSYTPVYKPTEGGVLSKMVPTAEINALNSSTPEVRRVGDIVPVQRGMGDRAVHYLVNPPSLESPAHAQPEVSAEKDPRYERLFAPPEIQGDTGEDNLKFDYGKLWAETDEEVAELEAYQRGYDRQVEERRAAEEQKFRVTEDSERKAFSRLIRAMSYDEALEEIVRRRQAEKHIQSSLEMVDLIRTDADLRYDLGAYLMDKLKENIYKMPDRVAVDRQKTPEHIGYKHLGRLSSQEYAVLLALAMLDGTYHEPDHNPIKRLPGGQVELGQHRAAAEILLSY